MKLVSKIFFAVIFVFILEINAVPNEVNFLKPDERLNPLREVGVTSDLCPFCGETIHLVADKVSDSAYICQFCKFRFSYKYKEKIDSIWHSKVNGYQFKDADIETLSRFIENESVKFDLEGQGVKVVLLVDSSLTQREKGTGLYGSTTNNTSFLTILEDIISGTMSYEYVTRGKTAYLIPRSLNSTGLIVLKGRCIDALSEQPVREVQLQVSWQAARRATTVVAKDGEFLCVVKAPWLLYDHVSDPRIFMKSDRQLKKYSLSLFFKAAGYKDKRVDIDTDSISYFSINEINIRMEPDPKHPVVLDTIEKAVSYKGVHSYMITCANRNSLFVMISGHSNKLEEDDVSNGYGIAYNLMHDGKLVETWRVEGWYAYTTYLGDNGECLVRIWDRHIRGENKDDDPAIAFYNQGKLRRIYTEQELRKFTEAAVKIPVSANSNGLDRLTALKTCFLERSKSFMYVSPWGTVFYFHAKTGSFKHSADIGKHD